MPKLNLHSSKIIYAAFLTLSIIWAQNELQSDKHDLTLKQYGFYRFKLKLGKQQYLSIDQEIYGQKQ